MLLPVLLLLLPLNEACTWVFSASSCHWAVHLANPDLHSTAIGKLQPGPCRSWQAADHLYAICIIPVLLLYQCQVHEPWHLLITTLVFWEQSQKDFAAIRAVVACCACWYCCTLLLLQLHCQSSAANHMNTFNKQKIKRNKDTGIATQSTACDNDTDAKLWLAVLIAVRLSADAVQLSRRSWFTLFQYVDIQARLRCTLDSKK
jgi:hypothetical protein